MSEGTPSAVMARWDMMNIMENQKKDMNVLIAQ